MRLWVRIAVAIVFLLAHTVGVQITSLEVPAEVLNASHLTVLDCEYTLRPLEFAFGSGLVVKWYWNYLLVYQWIPGNRPRDLGILKGQLDMRYRASEDPAMMHRALYITTPTTRMSGEYMCVVSTFDEEDFMLKKMIVYAPERSMELILRKIDYENLIAFCTANGVYPEPKLSVYILTGNNTKKVVDGVQVETVARTGEYDVKAKVLLTVEGLEAPTEFVCELRIPGTTYTTNRSVIYYPDTEDGSSFPRPSILTVVLIGVFFMFKLLRPSH